MRSKSHDTWRVAFCLAALFTAISIALSSALASVIAAPPLASERLHQATDAGHNSVTVTPDMGAPDMAAESREQENRQLQLALAKVCVAEAGFQVRSNDCTLIYHVLRTRSVTGELTLSIMRAYAKRTFNERRRDSRRWIVNLNHELTEPRGWAENVTVPWSARQEGYESVYNHAGSLVRTRPTEAPCGVKVSHWAARGFRQELHLRQGWKLVRCGNTHNNFWYVPSRQSTRTRQVESPQEVASL